MLQAGAYSTHFTSFCGDDLLASQPSTGTTCCRESAFPPDPRSRRARNSKRWAGLRQSDGLSNGCREILRDARHFGLVFALHHDPYHRLGAGRPDQHPPPARKPPLPGIHGPGDPVTGSYRGGVGNRHVDHGLGELAHAPLQLANGPAGFDHGHERLQTPQ